MLPQRSGILTLLLFHHNFGKFIFVVERYFSILREREFKAIIILHAFAYDAVDDEYTE